MAECQFYKLLHEISSELCINPKLINSPNFLTKLFVTSLRRCKRDTTRICCRSPCGCGYGSKGGRACCSRAVQQSVDITCPRSAQQQTRRTLLQRSIDGTDGRTDAGQFHRPVSRTRAVSTTRASVSHIRTFQSSVFRSNLPRLPFQTRQS